MSKKKQETVMRGVLFVDISEIEANTFNSNLMSEEKRLELKKLMSKTTARVFFGKDPLWASPWDIFYGGDKLAPTKKKGHAAYVFIDGWHRWVNAKELKAEGNSGWSEVGLDVEDITEAEARQRCYSKNYLRGETDPLREAKLFKADVDEGKTQEYIAEKYFKDPSYISSSLALLSLPKEIQMMLYVDDPNLAPLTKSHLLQLVGLPEEEMKNLSESAMRNGYSVNQLRRQSQRVKEGLEAERARVEAESHFVMKTCPICDAPGEIYQDLKSMRCSDNYTHVSRLKIRSPDAINWGPLDTKESMLKKKIMLDSGKKFSLADIIAGKGKEKGQGSPIKRRNNWFKYEKTIPEVLPKLVDFAYNMLVANREAYTIEEISIRGRPIGSKQSTEWRRGFRIGAGGNRNDGIDIQLDEREMGFSLEAKEWKRGPHKIRVNVQGINDDMEDAEARLKLVQGFLDKLMKGDAKVEDFPFEAVAKPKRVEGPIPDMESKDEANAEYEAQKGLNDAEAQAKAELEAEEEEKAKHMSEADGSEEEGDGEEEIEPDSD